MRLKKYIYLGIVIKGHWSQKFQFGLRKEWERKNAALIKSWFLGICDSLIDWSRSRSSPASCCNYCVHSSWHIILNSSLWLLNIDSWLLTLDYCHLTLYLGMWKIYIFWVCAASQSILYLFKPREHFTQ